MSLRLANAIPQIEVSFEPGINEDTLFLGDVRMPMSEFCHMALYVLQTLELAPDDPRRELVRLIKSIQEVRSREGEEATRLEVDPRLTSRD